MRHFAHRPRTAAAFLAREAQGRGLVGEKPATQTMGFDNDPAVAIVTSNDETGLFQENRVHLSIGIIQTNPPYWIGKRPVARAIRPIKMIAARIAA